MTALTERDRDKLRKSQFAYVDRKGGEHLPINDESHIRNAMARWNQTEFQSATAKEQRHDNDRRHHRRDPARPPGSG